MIAPSTMLSGGTGSLPNADDLVSLAGRLQFDRLDGARPDVEADDRFRFAETKHWLCPALKADVPRASTAKLIPTSTASQTVRNPAQCERKLRSRSRSRRCADLQIRRPITELSRCRTAQRSSVRLIGTTVRDASDGRRLHA